jgi:hypothetical protein
LEHTGELEVAEMVCPELHFEAVLGAAERGEHHARVVHQDVHRGRRIGDRGRTHAGQ